MTQTYGVQGMRSMSDFDTMWKQSDGMDQNDAILARRPMAHLYPEGELQVELVEKTDAYWLIAELPGMQQDDITIQVDGEILSIIGEWAQEATIGDSAQRMRPCRGFARRFRLDKPVETDTLSMTYADGVLTVCVPKLAPVQTGSLSHALVES